MIYVKIFNQGEIPAMPSGFRHVFAKEGRKWVTLIDWTMPIRLTPNQTRD